MNEDFRFFPETSMATSDHPKDWVRFTVSNRGLNPPAKTLYWWSIQIERFLAYCKKAGPLASERPECSAPLFLSSILPSTSLDSERFAAPTLPRNRGPWPRIDKILFSLPFPQPAHVASSRGALKSASVPKKDLAACARGVGRGDEMAGMRLLAKAGAHQGGKAVKALAHVGGARNQKDAGGRTSRDHTTHRGGVRRKASLKESKQGGELGGREPVSDLQRKPAANVDPVVKGIAVRKQLYLEESRTDREPDRLGPS